MIDKVNINTVQNILSTQASKPAKLPASEESFDSEKSFQIFNCLVEKAKTADNSDAVEQARKLLICGKLDSMEAISAAAKKIVERGI